MSPQVTQREVGDTDDRSAMHSMREILVFSDREQFAGELRHSVSDYLDLRLNIVSQLDDALAALEQSAVDIVVVDNVGEIDFDVAVSRLVPLMNEQSPTPLLCFVGRSEGHETEASVVFKEGVPAKSLLGKLSGVNTRREADEEESYERNSIEYLVPDSGLMHPSSTGHQSDAVRRLLYVGERNDFRQGLVAQAEAHGVELILRDRPSDVVWPKGAQALSMVAIEVGDRLERVRRLIGYFGERHSGNRFRIALIASETSDLTEPVAELLGADHFFQADVSPARLVDEVESRATPTERGRILLVSSRNGLIRKMETALATEGVSVEVRTTRSEIVDYVDTWSPQIICFDAASRALDIPRLARGLQEARPFMRTRYLGIRQSIAARTGAGSRTNTTEATFPDALSDVSIDEPVIGRDLRGAVAMLLDDLRRGQRSLDVDALTRACRSRRLPDAIDEAMSKAADDREHLLVIGLDIDDLSLLNVRYSWRLGDSVLRTLADMLRVAMGGREQIFRHDDMFFVVSRGDEETCREIQGRIQDSIELFQRQTFRSEDGRGTYATVSGGAVTVPPLDIPPETILKKCWIVLERACSSRRQNLLTAQLDPDSFPSLAARVSVRTDGNDE